MGEQGDAYVVSIMLTFDSREHLDGFRCGAAGGDRSHDVLRTGVVWEGLSEPVQVVWREARLPVQEVQLSAGGGARELRERFDPQQ